MKCMVKLVEFGTRDLRFSHLLRFEVLREQNSGLRISGELQKSQKATRWQAFPQLLFSSWQDITPLLDNRTNSLHKLLPGRDDTLLQGHRNLQCNLRQQTAAQTHSWASTMNFVQLASMVNAGNSDRAPGKQK